VAIVRDGAGRPTGGIHRTFLLDDGSDKALPGKKMLGPVAGGHIRLAPLGADGRLGVAKGIETALAASILFGIPVWAGLSADGMKRFQWPEGTRHLTIFADAGEAGHQAAATLADRLNQADIPNTIVAPLHGDDFNDDLQHGACAADYGKDPAGQPALPLRTLEEMEATALALTCPPNMADLARLLGAIATARLEPVPIRHLLTTIKATTRIPVSVLEKQLRDLRRRLNGADTPAVRLPWAGMLRIGDDGTPERNEANVITALSNDPAFAGALIFDEFRQEVLVGRPLPWESGPFPAPRPWTATDDVRCAEWLQRREINVTPVVVSRSVGAVANDIRVHPVREYLNHLRWDGTPRLETWAIRYLGTRDTPLNRAFGVRWLISAVARVLRPGAKVDHMLILEGPQGTGKSTALKILAGEDWFTDELAEIGSKDCAQQMRGVWIIEIAELDAIGRAEVERIKSFLTRTVDRYRPPYERYVIDVPRQCVFAGSVNPDTYLRDETGNRRFWPLRCGRIDLDGLRQDRNQLWAEAVVRYRDGAIWWLDDPDLIAAAKVEQEARYQGDAWDARIDRWLTHERRRVNRGALGYDDWRKEEVERDRPIHDVSVGEILEGALGIEASKWSRGDQMRVAAYLKARRWERYKAGAGDRREWRYRRPTWLND
jgi:predicted P-loop ATPase